jgi:hypothetical protein
MARQKKTTAKQRAKPSKDDIGDAFPNDWIEALILFVAGIGIFGGIVTLFYLADKVPQ